MDLSFIRYSRFEQQLGTEYQAGHKGPEMNDKRFISPRDQGIGHGRPVTVRQCYQDGGLDSLVSVAGSPRPAEQRAWSRGGLGGCEGAWPVWPAEGVRAGVALLPPPCPPAQGGSGSDCNLLEPLGKPA